MGKIFLNIKSYCPKKCCENIPVSDQKKLLKLFYELSDKSLQDANIASCIKFEPVKLKEAVPKTKNCEYSWKNSSDNT